MNPAADGTLLFTDQRGYVPTSGVWDVGAYQFDAVPAPAPTATVSAANVPVSGYGQTSYEFTVTYDGAAGLVPSTVAGATVEVTPPGGGSPIVATVVSSSASAADAFGNEQTITVTYMITPPGGSWTAVDNGNYSISLTGSPVTDAEGQTIADGTVGNFQVQVAKIVINKYGLTRNPITHLWSGTIKLTNTSDAAISGPIFVLFNLPGGAILENATGTYGSTPYLEVNVPGGSLAMARPSAPPSPSTATSTPPATRLLTTSSIWDRDLLDGEKKGRYSHEYSKDHHVRGGHDPGRSRRRGPQPGAGRLGHLRGPDGHQRPDPGAGRPGRYQPQSLQPDGVHQRGGGRLQPAHRRHPGAANPVSGSATGDLTTPGGVTANNAAGPNELVQGFSVASFFDVFVTISGSEVGPGAVGPTTGTVFSVFVYDSSGNSEAAQLTVNPNVDMNGNPIIDGKVGIMTTGPQVQVILAGSVPEPSSVVLMGLGIGAVVVIGRRRWTNRAA